MSEHTTEIDQWNPRWNYHLGGLPLSVCRCADGPYEGARPATWPRWCERCGGVVDAVAEALQEALYAESRSRLEQWAAENPDLALPPGMPTEDTP